MLTVGVIYLAMRVLLQRQRLIGLPKWLSHQMLSNPALNLAPSGRWTLRDKAAQRRLALR
jgi:hypothetical protein